MNEYDNGYHDGTVHHLDKIDSLTTQLTKSYGTIQDMENQLAHKQEQVDRLAHHVLELERQLADEQQDCAGLALQVAKLEQQLSRYQGAVEVEDCLVANNGYGIYPRTAGQCQLVREHFKNGQRVRVLVKEVE